MQTCDKFQDVPTPSPPLPTDAINIWAFIRTIFKKCEWKDLILQRFNLSVTTFLKCLIF